MYDLSQHTYVAMRCVCLCRQLNELIVQRHEVAFGDSTKTKLWTYFMSVVMLFVVIINVGASLNVRRPQHKYNV